MEHVVTENNNLKRKRTKSFDDDKINTDNVEFNDCKTIKNKNIKSAFIVSDLSINKNDLGESIAMKKIPMFKKNGGLPEFTEYITIRSCNKKLTNSQLIPLMLSSKKLTIINKTQNPINDVDKNNSAESNEKEMEALMSNKMNDSRINIENEDNIEQQATSEIFEGNYANSMENNENEDTLALTIEELDENSCSLAKEEEKYKKNSYENIDESLDYDESSIEEMIEYNCDSDNQESNALPEQKLDCLIEDDCSNVIDLTLSDSDDDGYHKTGAIYMKHQESRFDKAGTSNALNYSNDIKKEANENNDNIQPQDDNENDQKTPDSTIESPEYNLYDKIKTKFSWVFKNDKKQQTDNANKTGKFSSKTINKIEVKKNSNTKKDNIVNNTDPLADDSLIELNSDKKKATFLSLKLFRSTLRKHNTDSLAVNENSTDKPTVKFTEEDINEKKNTDEPVKLSDKNNEIEDEILSMFEEYDPDEIPVESFEKKNDNELVKIDLTNDEYVEIKKHKKNRIKVKEIKKKPSKNDNGIYTIDLTDDKKIKDTKRNVKSSKSSVPKKEKKIIVKKIVNKPIIRKRKLIIKHHINDESENEALKENDELVEEQLGDSCDEILPKKQRKFEESSNSQSEKNDGNVSEFVEEELDCSSNKLSSLKSKKSQGKNSNKQMNKAKYSDLTDSESDGSFRKNYSPKRKISKKSSNNKKKSKSNEKKNNKLVEEELESNKKNNKLQQEDEEENEEETSDYNNSLVNINYHDELDYDYDELIESEKITNKKPQNEKRKRSKKINEESISDEPYDESNEDYDPNYKSTYLQLMDIFPNADEDWMKRKVKLIYRKQRLITSFVTKNLEQPEYKTKYIEKSQQLKSRPKPKKLTPDILYTTEFNAKNFLKLFPRPHRYFEDPNRECQPSFLALEFLKSKFKKFSKNTITKVYHNANYNMSLAANVLSKTQVEFNIDIPRQEFIYPDEDIEFLQESAFINYREDIKNEYIKRKQKKIQIINTYLECQCCFSQEHISKCATCEGDHTFCHSCIISGTNTYLGDGESDVYCFAGCGEQISIAVLENILDAKQFKRLMKNKESVELMDVHNEGTTPCPFCKIGSSLSTNDKIFKCQNSDCMIESCVDCKMINHHPDPCNLTEIAKRLIENSMSQAITRECHNCQKIYIKDYGCNKITCICGVSLCYLCNKSIRGDSHFRKEGEKAKPNETPKCPYYCDDDYLNAQTVKKVGEEVKKKLIAINPTLDIDIDHLLPSIPAPTVDGPHQLIPDNTDIADDYVQQIVQKENFFSTKINASKST